MAGQPTAEQANGEGQRQRQRQSQSYSRRAPADDLSMCVPLDVEQGRQDRIDQDDLPISLLSDMMGKIVQVGWLVRRVKNSECRGVWTRRWKAHARTHRMEAGALGPGLGAGRKGFDGRVLLVEEGLQDG